jgi:ABC-2 type transport system permease protein
MSVISLLLGEGRWVRRLVVLTRKELLQLLRDIPLVLFFIYAFTLAMYISGSGARMELQNASLVVHDEDRSFSSRELTHRFRPPYFRYDGEIASAADGLARLDRGTAMVVLSIPPRFHEALAVGEQTAVQLLIDTSNAPQGLSAASYAVRIAGQFGQETAMRRLGIDPDQSFPVLRSQHRVWYNPNQRESWFESIGELLRVVTIFAVLLPAAAMVREKERGTIEQLLVSPLSPLQIMLSKVIAMTLVILAGTAASILLVMQPLLGVPVKGSLPLYFGLTALYTFTTAGIGLFVATVASNQAQAGMMTMLVAAPILLLSGTAMPFEAMPEGIRVVMALSPLRYYVDVTFGILLKGADLAALWRPVLAMLVLGAVIFATAVWRLRRQCT